MIDVTNFEETTSLETPPDGADDPGTCLCTCTCIICTVLASAAAASMG